MKVKYENIKLDKQLNTKSIDLKLEGLNSDQLEFVRSLLDVATSYSQLFKLEENAEFRIQNLIDHTSQA